MSVIILCASADCIVIPIITVVIDVSATAAAARWLKYNNI